MNDVIDLSGKRGLVVGIANEHSIAAGCAHKYRDGGADLAPRRVHVHAISAGAVKTRAASGLDQFDMLLEEVRARTPAQHLVTIEEIGRIAAVLASDTGMTLTGSTLYADAGFHIVA